MKIKILVPCVLIAVVANAYSQSPPLNNSSENTVNGIPQKDYIAAQATLTEAFDDPRVAKLTAEIEKLIDQRDELIFQIAAQRHPEKAENIKGMGDTVREQKKKRGSGHS